MIRVAQVLPVDFDSVGGMQTHVVMVSQALREHDVEPVIFGHGNAIFPSLTFVPVASFRPESFDIVHSHAQFGQYACIAKRMGVHSVHTSHGTILGNRLANRRLRSLLNPHNYRSIYFEAVGYRWADHVIAVSQVARRELERFYRVPHDKVTVIPNGYSCLWDASIDRTAERVRWGLNVNDFVFLFVGRDDDPQKRARVVVEAFRRLADEFSYVVLVMAPGARDYRHPRILCTGAVSVDTVCRLYHAADAYVMSSATEGFSLSLLDAMACGLPVVATPVGGALELVRDGETGLLARCNVREFHIGMKRLLMNQSLRCDLGRAAYEVAARYTWENVAKKTARVYHRILAGDSP